MRLLAKITIAGAVGILCLAVAGPASAHVTVAAPGAAAGGYAVMSVRVPTESDTLSTVGLKFALPTDTPIASVSVQPHVGWSFTTVTTKLKKPITTDDGPLSEAVSEVDWKADSAATAIKPGEFDQFQLSLGPLPKVKALVFKAIQIYSDGSQVKWIEQSAPGSTEEPDHPAPTLTLTATPAAPAPRPATSASKDDSSTGLAVVALVVGVVALAVSAGVFVLTARRRSTT